MSKLKFVGTWSLSKQLDIQHRSLKNMTDKHRQQLESWGLIPIRRLVTINKKGGATIKEYVLNEKQVHYLVMLLWNTKKVVILKKNLINNLR